MDPVYGKSDFTATAVMPQSTASPEQLAWRQQLADAQQDDAQSGGGGGDEGGPNAKPEQNEEGGEEGGPNATGGGTKGSPETWGQMMRQQLLQAQQEGVTDAQMGKSAQKLWKVYEKKMEDLRMDLATEMNPLSIFFFPVGIFGYALTDIVSVFDLGTFTTILNWIVYIITAFVIIYRVRRYATIQYRNVQRKIRRTQKLVHRATMRAILRMFISILEAIPFVGLLPIWSFVHQLEHYFEKQDVLKLKDIEGKRADTEKRLKRVWANAQRRGGMNALKVAMTAIKAVQILDKKYDEV